MIRLASDTDSTYQPFAMSNKALTDGLNGLIEQFDAIPIDAGKGTNSIVEGNVQVNVSDGENSHAEGKNTTAKNLASHSEGYNTRASANCSHAEGNNTTASGGQSHAEGQNAKATNICAHAEGYYTTASGNMAHAEGNSTNALGNHSHAQNLGTVAKGFNQTAIGKFNISQGTSSSSTDTDYALIIGNGTDTDHRSNALAVKWDGTVVFADGTIQMGAAIPLTDLKTLVAASTDFSDFKTRIAAL